jgi:hypothetical protein
MGVRLEAAVLIELWVLEGLSWNGGDGEML